MMDIWQFLILVDLAATVLLMGIMYHWGYVNGRKDEQEKHKS